MAPSAVATSEKSRRGAASAEAVLGLSEMMRRGPAAAGSPNICTATKAAATIAPHAANATQRGGNLPGLALPSLPGVLLARVFAFDGGTLCFCSGRGGIAQTFARTKREERQAPFPKTNQRETPPCLLRIQNRLHPGSLVCSAPVSERLKRVYRIGFPLRQKRVHSGHALNARLE